MTVIEPVMMKRCSKCGEEKPATLEYFFRQKNRGIGLHSSCKECERPGYTQRKRARLELNSLAQRGLKRCRKCKKEKPATPEYWHRNKNRKGGLQDECIICVRVYKYEYRNRNREKIKKYLNDYCTQNKNRIDQQRKGYYARNREWLIDRMRSYQAAKKAEKLRQSLRLAGFLTPSSEYFHGYCAVCAKELSKSAKPVIWTQRKPDMLVPLCNQCIADKGNCEPKDWLTRRYNAQRLAEIKRIMKDYFIWFEGVVNHAN